VVKPSAVAIKPCRFAAAKIPIRVDAMPIHETAPPSPNSLPAGDGEEALRAILDALEENLKRLAWAFDGISDSDWRAVVPAADGESTRPESESLLRLLCWTRDEEAYVVGRRVALLYQEESPEFEHLELEMAEAAAPIPFAEERPGRAFSELFKNRMAWLALARGEMALLRERRGALPPEEGGAELNLRGHLDWTLRRDAATLDAIWTARRALSAR
jgi:hypothetical protein